MTLFAEAQVPGKATTSFTLAFGLMNIPVSVYTGTERTAVTRKEYLFHDGAADSSIPIGRVPIRKDTGEVVESADVSRMAEATSGAWVVLTDDEIAQCTSPRGLAEVEAFVPLKDLGNYVVEKADQVRPKREKGKPLPGAEKALATFLAALKARKCAALVQVALRGPARYALVTPDGWLLYILPTDGVRQPLPLPTTTVKSEVDMALMLIDTVGLSTPVLHDDTATAVQAFVDDKAKGVKAPAPLVAQDTVDITEALRASVEAIKAKKAAA